ncbi:MAG TPA: glycosyltransferase family 4 protein [Methylophilus sp.]
MIAIVYPQFYGVGGIARYLDSFLANLPANHPPIYLMTGDEHQVDRQYPNVTIVHIPFIASRFNLLLWTIKARRILHQLYTAKKIQLVNLHIPPLITGLLLSSKIPMVLTAHTTYLGMSGRFYREAYFTSQWSRLEVSCKLWIERRIFKKSKKIISLTEQGRQELLAYEVTAPIEVIPNGVDLNAFQPMPVITKTYDVLFCGRIETRKGSRAMVDVCQLLIARKPDINILIVGYGDDDTWVKQHLAALPQVTLTGKVSFTEMRAHYAQCKLYASASYYEGLPGTCLEAMAMGLPAVVWDFPFYHGLVVPQKTGLLVKPNANMAMVEAIITLLKNMQQGHDLAHATAQHIQMHYNWQVLSKAILTTLQDVHNTHA